MLDILHSITNFQKILKINSNSASRQYLLDGFCERVEDYIELYVKKCLSWKKISFNTIFTRNIHLLIAKLVTKKLIRDTGLIFDRAKKVSSSLFRQYKSSSNREREVKRHNFF